MLSTLILVAAMILVAVLAMASARPDTFHVQRSIDIGAVPGAIYPFIVNIQAFRTWSPFEKADPGMKRTFSGPDSGPGATYAWEGNSRAGTGFITTTGAEPPSKVTFNLVMLKPFAADNTVTFTLVPKGAATTVTWAMTGRQPLMAKVMGLFMNCDTMVGREFEAGLSSLKTKAEARA
jgi:hypothetical protein